MLRTGAIIMVAKLLDDNKPNRFLPLTPRGFSPGTFAVKTITSKFQFDLERTDTFQLSS